MNSTNVDFYAAGFDKSGHRVVTKICDYDPAKSKHADKIAALLDDIKATSSDVVVAEIINADDFYKYTNENCVRDSESGKPVLYVPPEPTAEEKTASAAAVIAATYEPQLAALKDSLVTAVLIGDDALQAEIKTEYAELVAAYNSELEVLSNE